MSLPNFLIIGAAKSGTTSIAEYLDQHPDVFICPGKEPSYFALAGQTLPPPGPAIPVVMHKLYYSQCVTDYRSYTSLFQSVRSETAIGDASVRYLYFPEAPIRIKEAIPDVRIIAILREPVARLYSHYCMNVQFQFEPLSLPEAIAAEMSRREASWGWDWHYVNAGHYSKQLQRYYELFSREQIKVFLYEDFVTKPLGVIQEICRHIGVNEHFVPDMSSRGKVAFQPKNRAVDRWLHWPRTAHSGIWRFIPRQPQSLINRIAQWNRKPVPKLDSQLRQEISVLFREDVAELEDLLGRKTHWYA